MVCENKQISNVNNYLTNNFPWLNCVNSWASVAVHLNFVFKTDAFLGEEFVDVASVVSLKLDNGAPLCVLVGGAIATPSFLKLSQDLFKVKVIWEALHQRKTFSRGSLLEV